MGPQVKVIVEGRGTFQISVDKVAELMEWLSTNQAVAIHEQNTVREIKNNKFTGRELLNG